MEPTFQSSLLLAILVGIRLPLLYVLHRQKCFRSHQGKSLQFEALTGDQATSVHSLSLALSGPASVRQNPPAYGFSQIPCELSHQSALASWLSPEQGAGALSQGLSAGPAPMAGQREEWDESSTLHYEGSSALGSALGPVMEPDHAQFLPHGKLCSSWRSSVDVDGCLVPADSPVLGSPILPSHSRGPVLAMQPRRCTGLGVGSMLPSWSSSPMTHILRPPSRQLPVAELPSPRAQGGSVPVLGACPGLSVDTSYPSAQSPMPLSDAASLLWFISLRSESIRGGSWPEEEQETMCHEPPRTDSGLEGITLPLGESPKCAGSPKVAAPTPSISQEIPEA